VTTGAGLVLQSVGKSFGDRNILSEIDLEIPAGRFVSLIGPSGVGKSTLLRIVAGLEPPTTGRVELQSCDGRPDVRMMFQEDRLMPWRTVLRNVTLGLKRREHDARRMLSAVGLAGREDDFPLVLSGGQRQRVALARALIHEPDLLLLDEPFGALDAITRATMQLLLEELLLLSDRVLLMSGGGIARDLAIEQPRPRHRGDPKLAALKEDLLNGLLTGGSMRLPSVRSLPLKELTNVAG
jgi:sulfonate transport system ATP-binding protein